MHAAALRQRDLLRFWLPLASTWMMMALEGPFLAALITRRAEPLHNLAAFGVAFAVAILVEAPVIMLLGASTALVDGRQPFLLLRRFTWLLSAVTTLGLALLVGTPLFSWLLTDGIGLEPAVATLTRGALWILLPWPAAIGYRRFHQGLLIRSGSPGKVASGTVLRLLAMAAAALGLFFFSAMPGVWIAAAALTAGVTCEAFAARLMAHAEVQRLSAHDADPGMATSYREIWRFYRPLAWTSLVSLAAHPLITFFMGHAPRALESLAVLPVLTSLAFVFRSFGLAYQEVAITMLARQRENRRPVLLFAAILGASASGGFALIVATPLSRVWFVTICGFSEELFRFALLPAWILIPIPALSVLLSMQRALLIHQRATRPITWATIAEIGGIAATLTLLIQHYEWVGAAAASAALLAGRLAANLILVPQMRTPRARS